MATLTGDTLGALGAGSLHAASKTMYHQSVVPATTYENPESSDQIVEQCHVTAPNQGNVDLNNGLVHPPLPDPHSSGLARADDCQIQPDSTTGVTDEADDQAPTINIVINNVVSTFATRCHLNLKRIATEGTNVIYRRENGMVSMKIRRPYTTASIWSSGKITCTGATSEEDAKIAARRFTRILQGLNFKVRFTNFRVVNVLGTCSLPFGIRITLFSQHHKENSSYEPELHPGVTYRLKMPKATLKIFSTGSITVTAPCVMNVQTAIEHIFPLVYEYRMEDMSVISKNEVEATKMHLSNPNATRQKQLQKRRLYNKRSRESEDSLTETSDEEYDSDESAY